MFFAKIPRHTRQNAITEGDSECILTRNCEGTEQLRLFIIDLFDSKKEIYSVIYEEAKGKAQKNRNEEFTNDKSSYF